MDIYNTKPGDRVKYTGKGGYDSDRELANKYLTIGECYTVCYIAVYDWYSTVELEEFENIEFNTVLFE